MKALTAAIFLILIGLSGHSSAQVKRVYETLGYTPPAGWQEEKDEKTLSYSTEDAATGAFCAIVVAKPTESTGDSKMDFNVFWEGMVEGGLKLKGKLQRGNSGSRQGWATETGVAAVDLEGREAAAIITTLTGSGKFVAVLALTNSEKYQNDIEAFVDGLVLPGGNAAAPSAPVAAAANSKLVGRWQRSSSGHPTYADAASWGTAGYTKSRYQFNPDGTYVYTERTFRMSHPNIFVVKESGRYTLSGEELTVSPAKSTISSYKKAGGTDTLGQVVRSQSRPLETVSYKVNFHYFEGIGEWNLVLQSVRPTQRDGEFSGNKTFENAWYFDQKYTAGDLTAARID